MGTPIKRSIRTIQQHQHCTVPSTTSTMKIAIVSLVLVAAVSVNGGVLSENGMSAIETIIENIDDMSKGATDLNTMEKRLEGLQGQKDEISNALAALTVNLDKKNLGTNSKDNEHDNMKKETPGDETSAWVSV